MGMSTGGGKGAKSEINVTPLVDVCLVLLIIFMVMIPRNVPEISVRLPPESNQRKPPTEGPLVIGLSEEGALTLNRTPMDREKLATEIQRQIELRDNKAVFVDFEDTVKYGDGVEILDLARKSGAEVLGIIKPKGHKTPDTL